jgi:polysaccharide biosynthesis protein PslH
VCTAKSAEGLDVVDGTHVRLAETPTAFVDAIRDLHGDARASAALGTAARALVEARYDWRAWVPGLLEVYVAQAPAC